MQPSDVTEASATPDTKRPAKRVPGTDADGILHELTTRQHLTPHRPLGQVMADIVEQTGACPDAADRALDRLELDRSRSIGRLRRGELIQLARSMYRLWASALAADANSPEPVK